MGSLSTSRLRTRSSNHHFEILKMSELIMAAIIPNQNNYNPHPYFRSKRSSEDTSLSQADLSGGMCFIMYTSGAEEKLSCLQRTACEDPKTAFEYGTAARMVYKVHKMVGLDFNPKYETILSAIEDARKYSLR